MHKRKNRIKEILFPGVTFIVILVVWQLIDLVLGIKEIILPNPIEIFSKIIGSFDILISHTYITMLESVLGFVIGSIFGTLPAIQASRLNPVDALRKIK